MTELAFTSGVTDKSVDVIAENLSNTQTKINANWVESFAALKKLAAMPHLKVLQEPDIYEDWEIDEIRKLMPNFPDDFTATQIKIAEAYDFMNDMDYQKGFTANRFWEIEAKPRTYDDCKFYCPGRDENCQCPLIHEKN